MKEFHDFLKTLSAEAKKTRTPLIGAFELTGRCNFNCVMCYVHEQDHTVALKNELSTEQWISIFDALIERGMIHAVLSGGECLLRDDFKELYLYLHRHGVRVSVNTNGYLIDTDYISFFKKYPPVDIQITLYGSCDEAYCAVTERPVFAKVAKSLSLLKEANISLRVVITPCKQLLPDFENIVNFLIKHKYRYSIGEFLIENKHGDVLQSDTSISYDDYLWLMKRNAELQNRLYEPPASLPEPFGACDEPSSSGCGINCSAGTCRATIDWHGDLYSCFVLSLPKFNLLELGFDRAWQLMGEELAKIKLPVECKGCAYEKVCIRCPAIRYNGLYSGHCDPQCCKSTMDLCKLGVKRLP